MFDSALEKLLRTSMFHEQEALRQRYLFEGPSTRALRELSAQDDFLKRISYSGIYSAADVLSRQIPLFAQIPSYDIPSADWLTPRFSPVEATWINRLEQVQSHWAESISAELQRTSFLSLATSIPKTFDLSNLVPRLGLAFQSAALEFPDELDGFQNLAPEVVHDIAEGVTRALNGDSNIARSSIVSFLADILDHYEVRDERGRARVLFIIALVLISVIGESAAEIVGVEWGRWRDGNIPAQEQRSDLEIETQAEIRRLIDLAQHPPREASVIRRAWLRAAPSKTSAQVGPILEIGTSLIVFERKDGWVRVEAEPTPGEVRTGWVYGRLTQYR